MINHLSMSLSFRNGSLRWHRRKTPNSGFLRIHGRWHDAAGTWNHLEASGRHLEGIHLRFSPLAWKMPQLCKTYPETWFWFWCSSSVAGLQLSICCSWCACSIFNNISNKYTIMQQHHEHKAHQAKHHHHKHPARKSNVQLKKESDWIANSDSYDD